MRVCFRRSFQDTRPRGFPNDANEDIEKSIPAWPRSERRRRNQVVLVLLRFGSAGSLLEGTAHGFRDGPGKPVCFAASYSYSSIPAACLAFRFFYRADTRILFRRVLNVICDVFHSDRIVIGSPRCRYVWYARASMATSSKRQPKVWRIPKYTERRRAE